MATERLYKVVTDDGVKEVTEAQIKAQNPDWTPPPIEQVTSKVTFPTTDPEETSKMVMEPPLMRTAPSLERPASQTGFTDKLVNKLSSDLDFIQGNAEKQLPQSAQDWLNQPGPKEGRLVSGDFMLPSVELIEGTDPNYTNKDALKNVGKELLISGLMAPINRVNQAGKAIGGGIAALRKFGPTATKTAEFLGESGASGLFMSTVTNAVNAVVDGDEFKAGKIGKEAAIDAAISGTFTKLIEKGVLSAATAEREIKAALEFKRMRKIDPQQAWRDLRNNSWFGEKLFNALGSKDLPGRWKGLLSGTDIKNKDLIERAEQINQGVMSSQLSGSQRSADMQASIKDKGQNRASEILHQQERAINQEFERLKGSPITATMAARGKEVGDSLRTNLDADRAELKVLQKTFDDNLKTGKQQFVGLVDGQPVRTELSPTMIAAMTPKQQAKLKLKDMYHNITTIENPVDVTNSSKYVEKSVKQLRDWATSPVKAISGPAKETLAVIEELAPQARMDSDGVIRKVIDLKTLNKKFIELDIQIDKLRDLPGKHSAALMQEALSTRKALIKDIKEALPDDTARKSFMSMLGKERKLRQWEMTSTGQATGRGRGLKAQSAQDILANDEQIVKELAAIDNAPDFERAMKRIGKAKTEQMVLSDMIGSSVDPSRNQLNAGLMRKWQMDNRYKLEKLLSPQKLRDLDVMTNLLDGTLTAQELHQTGLSRNEFQFAKELKFVAPWILPALLAGTSFAGAAAAGLTRVGMLGIERGLVGKILLDPAFVKISNEMQNAPTVRGKIQVASKLRDFLISRGVAYSVHEQTENDD